MGEKTVLCPTCKEQRIPQGKLIATERSVPVKAVKDGQPVLGDASFAQRTFESECPKCGHVRHHEEATDPDAKPN